MDIQIPQIYPDVMAHLPTDWPAETYREYAFMIGNFMQYGKLEFNSYLCSYLGNSHPISEAVGKALAVDPNTGANGRIITFGVVGWLSSVFSRDQVMRDDCSLNLASFVDVFFMAMHRHLSFEDMSQLHMQTLDIDTTKCIEMLKQAVVGYRTAWFTKLIDDLNNRADELHYTANATVI